MRSRWPRETRSDHWGGRRRLAQDRSAAQQVWRADFAGGFGFPLQASGDLTLAARREIIGVRLSVVVALLN